MKFSDIVEQAKNLLQRKGRVTYRALKLEFDLSDEHLDVLKDELIEADRVAVDEAGKILVWTGDGAAASAQSDTPSQSQPPASYTPQHLAERILAEQAALESRGSANGERKTITALFADLKGSTALIEGLDPEDARAIIDPALQVMMDAVHRYDGYVAQALGDGIFALFGAPIAHEDHPQRALYAALRMQEEMRGYGDQVRLKHGVPLQMRVGINTGEVVVRSIRKDDLHTDYVPVGHSTNLAARMEQLANPGSIVVSEYTRKLTEGYFELKSLGAAEIKGVEEPLNVYEVLGAGPLRTRLQVSTRRGLSRFVGRQSELDRMSRALDQAKAGHGQIVGVMGEPGLGKSRLFYEFKLTSQSECLVLEAVSVSHGKASPYLPIIELLKTYFQIEPSDAERIRKEKITGRVLTLDRSLEETLPYLFSLLGIEAPDTSLQQMDAQIRRRRTFEALKKLFLRESLNQPLIVVFEDLHWIDTETQGFLDTLSESVASVQLLLLANYRPEYRHEWGSKTYYTQLRLAPLGKAEAEELLTSLLGNSVSLTALKPLILEKTEGTPFFMEEVVQTLAEERALRGERGSYSLETTPTALHISPTVQGVLAARIDRLSAEEKALLQQLAVIGRQFPVSLVKQVVPQSEAELYRVLSSLQAKEFLYEQPAFPEVEYLFKHALTQDVAYGTVLHEQRKAQHEKTGRALEALYAESLDEYYGALAYHYSRSENTEKAVTYLQLAGQQALQRSANVEAIRYLTQGLDLLAALPATVDTQQRELQLHLTLGPAFMATKGYGAPEVMRAYGRARELSEQLGDPVQQFTVLRSLYTFYLVHADLPTLQELTEQLLQLAERVAAAPLLSEAYSVAGWTHFEYGQMRPALAALEHSLALYDPGYSTVLRWGLDSGVMIRSELAWLSWMCGYPDQARTHTQQALARAQTLSHPGSSADAMTYAAVVHHWRREPHAAQALIDALMPLTVEHGFLFWEGWAQLLQGGVFVERGEGERGISQLQKGWARFAATEAKWGQAYFFTLLAEGYRKVGRLADGLSALSEALAHVETTQERFYEAELYRLKGELVLEQAPENWSAGEAAFQRALAIARQQEAKSWELRAATSLTRLWQSQGKTTEAHDLLAPVYDWFTEGFDTADLKDAKTLLEELA